MILIPLKFPVYLALLLLAFSCIQAANANNPTPQSGCKCKNIALILKIIGCGTIMLSVHYEPPFQFVIMSIIPLIVGTAMWDLTADVAIHHKMDKWVTSFKLRLLRLKEKFSRDRHNDESPVRR